MRTDGGGRGEPPFTIGRARPGDHLCHVVEAPGEAATVAASYLAGALDRGFAALWLHAPGAAESCGEALSSAGVDVEAARARGVLALEPAEGFLLSDGRLDPAAARLGARVAATRAAGHAALFVTTEFAPALAGSAEALIRWETRLGAPEHASALCQFDRRRLSAELVRSMVRIHPFVLHRGRILQNPEVLTADAALAREAPDDEVTRLLANLRERTDSEEALRRSERLHWLFAENAADLIFRYRLAPTPGFEYVSPASVAIAGYTPEEHYADPELGRKLVHPDDLAVLAAALEGTGAPVTFRWLHKDGRTVWVEQRSVLVHDSTGRPIALEGVARDVTARVHAEERLRESEERLRFALECAGHCYWEFTPGAAAAVEGHWWRMLGWSDQEVALTADAWRARVHPDDLPGVEAALAAHLEGRTPTFRSVYRVRAKDGAWRWILAAGRRRPGRAGQPERVAGTLTDVTETHDLADRARASERLASIGTLAGGLAHEVNNPLAGLVSSLGHVREELSRAAAVETAPGRLGELSAAVDDALAAAGRVGSIVRGLQQFASPIRSHGPGRVDVRAELLAAVGITRNELAHRARLELEIPDALPAVVAHPGELGQAFVNLLVNATQALPEGALGEVRVTARVEGGEVVVEVSDTGVGMKPEVLAHAVEPFFTTRPVGGGAGLGLSIAHGIVAAVGGRLVLESVPGRGTRVALSVPAEAPAAARAQPAAPPPATADAARPSVLVIDDEPLVGRSLARLLRAGHDVTVLDSAVEAHRRLAAGERWDAILCDLMMPGLSGMDLEERLRKDAPDTVVRIVYMTGGAFTERARSFLADGRPWVEKPVEPAALRAAVAERVSAGRAERSPER